MHFECIMSNDSALGQGMVSRRLLELVTTLVYSGSFAQIVPLLMAEAKDHEARTEIHA